MKNVAIQGQEASFHHIAAQVYFQNTFNILSCETFAGVFLALKTGKADYAVAAIENSLYGSINNVYDLMLKFNFWICGEVYLRIEHHLLGLAGAKLSAIKEVHSQLEALAQCEEYLDLELPSANRIERHDTAGSAREIKQLRDTTKAAIASEQAAKLYDLEILAKNIETHPENYTRFVILQSRRPESVNGTKTSLILRTPSDTRPGALYRALGTFAKRDINLSLLHSRPIVGKAWHYIFYTDVGRGLQDQDLQAALDELNSQKCAVSILGSYISGNK